MTEKKLIPFDLERALAGDPVVTRNGKKVIAIHYWNDLKDHPYPVHVYLENYKNEEKDYLLAMQYDLKGESCALRSLDLFMLPKIKTLWVNIYKNEFGYFTCRDTCSTEADAIEAARGTFCYIKTISFEVEI